MNSECPKRELQRRECGRERESAGQRGSEGRKRKSKESNWRSKKCRGIGDRLRVTTRVRSEVIKVQ